MKFKPLRSGLFLLVAVAPTLGWEKTRLPPWFTSTLAARIVFDRTTSQVVGIGHDTGVGPCSSVSRQALFGINLGDTDQQWTLTDTDEDGQCRWFGGATLLGTGGGVVAVAGASTAYGYSLPLLLSSGGNGTASALWTTPLPGDDGPMAVSAAADAGVVAMILGPLSTELAVLRIADGALLATASVAQGDLFSWLALSPSGRTVAAVTRSFDGVVAYDVASGGGIAWKCGCEAGFAGLSWTQDESAVLTLSSPDEGGFAISAIDAASGKVASEFHMNVTLASVDPPRPPIGSVDPGVAYVASASKSGDAFGLAAIDLRTNETLWDTARGGVYIAPPDAVAAISAVGNIGNATVIAVPTRYGFTLVHATPEKPTSIAFQNLGSASGQVTAFAYGAHPAWKGVVAATQKAPLFISKVPF